MQVEPQPRPAGQPVVVATRSDACNAFRASSPPFTAFARLEGDKATVMLHGELDLASVAILIDCFAGIAFAVEEVVLDCTDLDFIDACGLRAIANAAQQVTAYGGSVSIHSPRPQVQRLLEIVDFKQIMTIEP